MDGLRQAPLYTGLTRPAMIAGVTYEAFIVTGVVAVLVFLIGKSLAWFLVGVPVYLICRLICHRDPRQFRLLMLWTSTAGKVLNRRGGVVALAPVRRARRYLPKEYQRG
jgi:type IV secretion system protein VirB3